MADAPHRMLEVHTRIMPILQMRTQRGSSISIGLQEMAELDLKPGLSSSNACAYDHFCSVLWGLSLPPSAPASWPGPLAPHQLQKPLRGRPGLAEWRGEPVPTEAAPCWLECRQLTWSCSRRPRRRCPPPAEPRKSQ